MGITNVQIEVIKEKLMNLPNTHRDNISKQAAIVLLTKEINILKKRGYGIEAIAQELTEAGLQISVPTLKCYLQRAKPRTGINNVKTPPLETPSVKKVVDIKGTFSTRPDSEEI